MNPDQVAGLAWRVGLRGDALITSVAVAGAESKYDETAVGDVTLENVTWGPSIGLWQVRTLKSDTGTGNDRDINHLTGSSTAQALAMYNISNGGTNWRPWSTYTNGAYRAHLAEATSAAQRVTAAGGSVDMGPAVTDHERMVGSPNVLVPNPANGPLDPATMMVKGAPLGPVADAIIGGSVDLTTDQIMQVTLNISDPDFRIAQTGLFTIGTTVDWANMRLGVAEVASGQGDGGEIITVTLWPRAIMALMQGPGETMTSVTAATWVTTEGQKAGFADVYAHQGAEHDTITPAVVDDVTGQKETSWQTIQRLAQEEGYWVWADQFNSLRFVFPLKYSAETQLLKVGWRGALGDPALDAVDCPACTSSFDNPIFGDTVEVHLPRWWGEQAVPGYEIQVLGVPVAFADSDIYMVTRVQWDLANLDTPVTVEGKVPVDPTPQSGFGTPRSDIPDGPGNKGTHLAADFVSFALRQAGKKYVFGDQTALGTDDPQAFDCSELVEWAAAQAGVTLPRTSGQQYAACKAAGTLISVDQAATTRGALLFEGPAGADHVAISLGDGTYTIEARGRAYGVGKQPIASRPWSGAGLVPGLIYGSGQSALQAANEGKTLFGRPN